MAKLEVRDNRIMLVAEGSLALPLAGFTADEARGLARELDRLADKLQGIRRQCPEVIQGGRCCLEEGHGGGHRWQRDD